MRGESGTYVSELVGDTREGRSERGRRHFGEVDGDLRRAGCVSKIEEGRRRRTYDTPCALHAELYAEGAGGECTEARG
jgi:hypothetical protein